MWPFTGVPEWGDHQENAKSPQFSVTYSLDLGRNSGRRMEPQMFTLHREPELQSQCRMAHGLSWHPEQGSHRGPWLAVPHGTPHTTASHSIMACASPSCSLRNLGGKTENVFLRAVLQPGQIRLTPFFLIFASSPCVLSCPV